MRHASRSDSTKTTRSAPRERASSPSAPEPANRSSTSAPSTGPIRLNAFSRTRSEVGRVAMPFGAAIRCPRWVPAMIRMSLMVPARDVSGLAPGTGGVHARPLFRQWHPAFAALNHADQGRPPPGPVDGSLHTRDGAWHLARDDEQPGDADREDDDREDRVRPEPRSAPQRPDDHPHRVDRSEADAERREPGVQAARLRAAPARRPRCRQRGRGRAGTRSRRRCPRARARCRRAGRPRSRS